MQEIVAIALTVYGIETLTALPMVQPTMNVAIALTVYGIETSYRRCYVLIIPPFKVAIALTVYGIETSSGDRCPPTVFLLQ